MKNQSLRKPRKSGLLNAVLLMLILFELMISIGCLSSRKNSLEYGIEYEKSPLLLQKAVVTNREDLRDLFHLYDDEKLYEICLTYENVANYTGTFRNQFDFKTGDRGYYIGMVYPEGSSSVGREAVYNQVVPPGKTGCFRFYISAPADAETIHISEKDDKLAGSGETLTLRLSSQVLGSDSWETAE